MLIPSIDLKGGRVVQLEQGEREVLASADLDGWVAKFSRFPLVQVIDLDAAMGSGENEALARYVCARLPCQFGGGVRSVDRARTFLDAGARRVILGSALFDADGVAVARAREFADAVGPDRLVAAVDSRAGRIVVHGWKTTLPIATVDAVRALTPYVDTFLATIVDTEGLMVGLALDAVLPLRQATDRRLIVAGGIKGIEEVQRLDGLGIDAVVGMAIYTGKIPL